MTSQTVDIATLGRQAAILLSQRRYEPAADAYVALLAARPDSANDWFNYGYVLRCLRRFEPALDAYARALTLRVQQPEEVHVNRAAILSDHLQRDAEAVVELEAALRANPRYVIALLNLGHIHEDHGRRAEARAAYARVLALDPLNGRALARTAAIDQFEQAPERAVASLRKALQHRLHPEDAAEIGFALGNALDAAGQYEEAWAALRSANDGARRLRPPAEAYSKAAHDRLIDALIATKLPPALSAGEDAPPLFICGMFRSGSTLAEQVLARHRDVAAGGELEALPAIVAQRLSPYPDTLTTATPDLLAELRDQYLREVAPLRAGAGIVTDKRPDNFLHIGLIKTLFPTAKIIHTRRDPIDTLVSIYALNFADGVAYGNDLGDIVHYIRAYRRLMAHWATLYPDDIFDLDYDRLVADPQPVVEGLLAFCDLDWDEACLSQKPSEASVRTASSWQVRQPLHNRSSGRWRNYAPFLAEVKAALD
ncbi:tetratricopeptide repeat-containing sulfotransferase family protein [Sphingomonas crocodyli]|uniref:Sulfotransferase family protein n=1 Tax=Sphingomonas crocodyli TaxID=1979270 RepID=A0A437M594_9SPHN|nr:sulfotransferase [Sphingomonas crocodyli]RVT92743.1 sulfotransferase family protein [Sphingomonas crocodyli]